MASIINRIEKTIDEMGESTLRLVGKTMTGLILTKKAQEAIQVIAEAKPEETVSQPEDKQSARLALIESARAIHAAQQRVLADLDGEMRGKLQALAATILLNEGQSKE